MIKSFNKKETVNHPDHYGGKDNPYEVIKVLRAWALGFSLGNAIKYVARAGKKDTAKTIEDLKKAIWYIQEEIEFLELQKKQQDEHVAKVIEDFFNQPPNPEVVISDVMIPVTSYATLSSINEPNTGTRDLNKSLWDSEQCHSK